MTALANPYSGTVLDVAEDQVERFLEAGWREPGDEPDQPKQGTDDGQQDPADDGSQGNDGADLFDPSTHTVEQVNEHLAEADDKERERVLSAERVGKNRSTVEGN